MKTVFQYGGDNTYKGAKTESLIQVDQRESGRKLFTVTYGLQRTEGLTYAQATRELGKCIFHYLACESILDNQGD